MIDRYAPADLRRIWSDQHRLELWLRVELAVCRARAELGEIGNTDLVALERAQAPSPARVQELEAEQGHDLAAFVSAVQEQLGPEGRWVHLGLTSQDVLDTALALQLGEVGAILATDLEELLAGLGQLAIRYRTTPMVGRTHGMHAEPLTFGLALANHWDELRRSGRRLRQALGEVTVGKVSGTVGTHATASPEVEERALELLGLRPAQVTTQVLARDRHAAFLCALALLGACLERLATNLRHLQRTEVGEVREPFSARQKGSSAMPHKRNPVRLEQVAGLARLLRGWALAGIENVALWHERDISHSSVERVALPDATMVTVHMLRTARSVLEGIEVDEQQMAANLGWRGQLYASQRVLLALIAAGWSRERAYRLVQGLAMTADRPGGSFRGEVEASPEVVQALGGAGVAACFDPGPYLAHVDATFARLGLIEEGTWAPPPAEKPVGCS